MAKQQPKRINYTKQDFLEKERELLGFNLTSIIGDDKLKVDVNGYKSLRVINQAILDGINIKDVLVASVVTKLEYKQSKAGNFFYWLDLSDDMISLRLYCSMKTFQEFSNELIKGSCVLFRMSVRNDFVTFDKCIQVSKLPLKTGSIFVIELPYGQWTNQIQEFISAQIDKTIRRGNCEVYLRTYPCGIFIDPTYDLVKWIKEVFNVDCGIKNSEDYLWGRSSRLIKEMESYGY